MDLRLEQAAAAAAPGDHLGGRGRLPSAVGGGTPREAGMTCTLHVAWDDRLTGYDFGPGHPMAPIRLKLTMELAQAFGLGRQEGVSVQVPAPATVAELELVHDPTYIGLVRLAGSPDQAPDKQELTSRVLLMHGLGTADDPVFP